MESAGAARSYLGEGMYPLPMAARLAKSSQQEVRRWLLGLTMKHKGAAVEYPPLWKPSVPSYNGKPMVSFMDLMEIRFVKYFRDHDMSLQSIRKVLDIAVREIGNVRPFATKQFQTDGKEFFMRVAEEFAGGGLRTAKAQATWLL